MSEGKDDESLSIGDLDGVASGYVYDTGESVEVIDNEGNVVESFALNKRSLTRRLPSPLPTVVALQAQGHWFEPSIAHQKTRGRTRLLSDLLSCYRATCIWVTYACDLRPQQASNKHTNALERPTTVSIIWRTRCKAPCYSHTNGEHGGTKHHGKCSTLRNPRSQSLRF